MTSQHGMERQSCCLLQINPTSSFYSRLKIRQEFWRETIIITINKRQFWKANKAYKTQYIFFVLKRGNMKKTMLIILLCFFFQGCSFFLTGFALFLKTFGILYKNIYFARSISHFSNLFQSNASSLRNKAIVTTIRHICLLPFLQNSSLSHSFHPYVFISSLYI